MEYQDFEVLSYPAKAEALRVGNTLVVPLREMAEFMQGVAPYIEDGEFISVERIGTLNKETMVFSVTMGTLLKVRSAEWDSMSASD